MKIVIIRHGETPQNLKGVFQGQSDPDLHQVGIERFKEVGQFFMADAWDAIHSSHYKRSVASADLINVRAKIKRVISADFAERHLGALDGVSKAVQLKADPTVLDKLMTLDFTPPQGESGYSALERFSRGIEVVKAEHTGRALIVSHGGVVALFAHFVLGVPRSSAFLEHGHALIMEVSGTAMSLVRMNVRPVSVDFNQL